MKRLALLGLALLFAAVAMVPGAAGAAEPFANGCPTEALDGGSVAKLNRDPAAKKAIVPAGAISMRICRYYGFGAGRQTPKTQARAGELQDQAEVRGRDLLESVTLEFKDLLPAPKGPISCPEDEGAKMYVVFSYRDAKPVFLDIGLSGCRFVAGGVPRARSLSTSLERRLVRLVEGKRAPGSTRDEVKEKRAVAYPPPHLALPVAEREVNEVLEEACAGACTSAQVTRCSRKSVAAVSCRTRVAYPSGEVCRGPVSVRKLEGEGLIVSNSGGTGGPHCEFFLEPPETREMLEEVVREHEAREG